MGSHPFAAMAADQDQARKEKVAVSSFDVNVEEERKRRYQHYLRMARTENFTDLNDLGALYRAGQ